MKKLFRRTAQLLLAPVLAAIPAIASTQGYDPNVDYNNPDISQMKFVQTNTSPKAATYSLELKEAVLIPSFYGITYPGSEVSTVTEIKIQCGKDPMIDITRNRLDPDHMSDGFLPSSFSYRLSIYQRKEYLARDFSTIEPYFKHFSQDSDIDVNTLPQDQRFAPKIADFCTANGTVKTLAPAQVLDLHNKLGRVLNTLENQ